MSSAWESKAGRKSPQNRTPPSNQQGAQDPEQHMDREGLTHPRPWDRWERLYPKISTSPGVCRETSGDGDRIEECGETRHKRKKASDRRGGGKGSPEMIFTLPCFVNMMGKKKKNREGSSLKLQKQSEQNSVLKVKANEFHPPKTLRLEKQPMTLS